MTDRNTQGTQRDKPCPWLCNLIPNNVPPPGPAQTVLHPRKDVFVLKVMAIAMGELHPTVKDWKRLEAEPMGFNVIAKVGATGDRRCKMELELVTPKYDDKRALGRIDTRETQCEPDPPPCTCCKPRKGKSKNSKTAPK